MQSGQIRTDWGLMDIAWEGRVLHGLSLPKEDKVPDYLWTSGFPQEVANFIDRYFRGERFDWPFSLDLSRLSPFYRRALEAAKEIPFGQVISYQDLAAKAGNPLASRAAGGAMASNPVVLIIPCHRVVASDRKLGGFGGKEASLALKRRLLSLEGWELANDRLCRKA